MCLDFPLVPIEFSCRTCYPNTLQCLIFFLYHSLFLTEEIISLFLIITVDNELLENGQISCTDLIDEF